MAQNYLGLVNRLRDRFNEPSLTTSNWNSVVGFDKLTKDAINYAIRDICNAETEWPFVAMLDNTIDLLPGTRTYTAVVSSPTAGLTANIRKIDWETFGLDTTATIGSTSVFDTVPATSPYTIDVDDDEWFGGLEPTFDSVRTFPGLVVYTAVDGDPDAFQYTIVSDGVYAFNSANAGQLLVIGYKTLTDPTTQTSINAKSLPYIDNDTWRQNLLSRDLALPGALDTPQYVYKHTFNAVGVTPIPDKPYRITFNCWVSPEELVDTTDTHVIPETFENVVLDGATKYCYDFREDPTMSKKYEDSFNRGIGRMRIELIGMEKVMRTGMKWGTPAITVPSTI